MRYLKNIKHGLTNKSNDMSKEINPTQNKIKDLRNDERPRERMMAKGASSLSDAELLAIIIRDGTKGYSALDISRDILKEYSSIKNIASYDYSTFKQFKGMGPAKAITLAAAFEIGKRINIKADDPLKKIKSPRDIAEYFIPILQGLKTEKFIVLLLNSSNSIFREIEISNGILNASLIHPREVFKIAISESAASIILLHNHPSGNIEASKEDIHITRQLSEAGKLLDIKVLDHLIIAGDSYSSFVEMGLL